MAEKQKPVDQRRDQIAQLVLAIYNGCVDPDADLQTMLAQDPNDFDADPSMFYETLNATFNCADPENDYFDGYGGTVQDTVNFITERFTGDVPAQADIDWG